MLSLILEGMCWFDSDNCRWREVFNWVRDKREEKWCKLTQNQLHESMEKIKGRMEGYLFWLFSFLIFLIITCGSQWKLSVIFFYLIARIWLHWCHDFILFIQNLTMISFFKRFWSSSLIQIYCLYKQCLTLEKISLVKHVHLIIIIDK